MAWVDIENLELLLSVRNKLNALGAFVDQLEQDIIANDGEILSNTGGINSNASAISSINNQLTNHIGQGGESNHALATGAEDGFMSKEHYTKLEAITPVNYASLTDPAPGAITTSMVDNNGGVLVTVTTASNALTIANPTLPTNRPFTVTNSSTSVEPILVDGTSIKPGSKSIFVWDSSIWADGKDYLLLDITDPVASAITQNIVDKYDGVVITTTLDGDDLTIAAPSSPVSGKKFTVIVDSASTHVVNVEGNPIQIDESVEFTWTGSAWRSDPLALMHKSFLGTSHESGLELTATLGATTFEVSEGWFYYVDNYTDRTKPVVKRIYYAGASGITLPNIASAFITFITIDKNATIKQYTTLPDARVDTYEVVLGAIGHSNLSTITSVANTKRVPSFNLGPRLYSLFSAILPIPTDDNDFGVSAASTDLTIERAAGTEVFIGNNPSDDQLPDRLSVAAQDPVTNFITFWRDGASGWNIDVSNGAITPSIYDNNTTSPSAPVGSVATNKWTIHRFFFSPGSGNAGLVMQYGQNVYDSKDNALNALNTESFDLYPPLKDTLFRTWLVIKGGCTNLSDPSQAVFVNVPKFGGAGGAGTTTNVDSQDAYNNSPDGNITTDGIRGAVKFQQGSGSDTDNVVEVLNGAGSTVASVTGEGEVTTAGNVTVSKSSGSAHLTINTGSASDTGVWFKENGTDRFRMENVAASDFLGFYNYATANYDFKLNYDGSTEVTSLKTQDATIEGTTRINSAAGADAEIEIIEGGNGGAFGTTGNDGYRIQSIGSSNVLKIQTGVGTTIKDVFVINRVTGNVGVGGNPSASSKLLINGDLAMAGTIFSLGTFIISTLPAASAYPNGVAKVTNDVNGHVLVMSNGTIWRRVFDNNAPSTT